MKSKIQKLTPNLSEFNKFIIESKEISRYLGILMTQKQEKLYFDEDEVNGILKYKWLPEVGATHFETWLQDKLYKPLEYFIYWRLNANFLTLFGPLPMLLMTLWVFFTGENPPRIGPNGREGELLSETFLLYFGLAMIFSSLIDAFDGNRARR